MKSIKEEYKKDLNIFIGIHVVLLYFILFGLNMNEIKKIYEDEFYKGIIIFILPIASVVLNGFLSNSLKEFLVFWRFKNRLPGYRVFSKYASKDARIDLSVLKEKYPDLKNENLDENKLWYKIYKKYETKPSVGDAQRNYLFTRDIIGLIFLFFLSLCVIDYFYDNKFIKIGCLLLGVEYLFVRFSCKNYAIKFVTNVLAEDSIE